MIKKGLSSLGIFFLYLLSLLPFWFLYLISDFLFLIVFYVARYRRKVVQQNLANAFPEKNADERGAIERKYFKYLCDLIVETIKLTTLSEKAIKERVKINNPELIEDAFGNGKSIIGAVGHYGNWEMGALRLSVLTDKRRIIVYKPVSNQASDKWFLRMRSRLGATLVPMKNTLRKFVEYRNELTFSVLVSDQTPVREEVQYFTTFLNQPTAVFLGIEKLSKIIDCIVIFCDVRRVKRGYYQCTFVPLINEPKQTAPYQVTEAHVRYLEKVIREEPQYWLWSHRRWKFKPEDVIK